MPVPGSNLLTQALRLIQPSTVAYYATTGRTLNGVGQYVASYATPVSLTASVQAVPRNTYKQNGLDAQRNYVNIFINTHAVDLARGTAGDQFVVDGLRYQLESETDWFARDGWVECRVVEIGSAI